MVEVIRNTVQKAKKVYDDDAWDFIQEWIDGGCYIEGRMVKDRRHLTIQEARFLVKVRRYEITPHKILPGQLYRSQFNKMDGDTYTSRAKEEFYQLACKYKLFPEE